MVVLAQTLSNVTHRSRDAVINLALQSATVLGDGRRASNRVVRRQVAASRAQTRSLFVVARNRLDRGLIALAIAAGTVARRSGRAAAHLSQRTSPLLSEARRAAHRFAILAWSRSVAAAESMNALGERARMSALRARPILSRALARPLEPALNRQEFNGLVVAVVLAVAAVGYGGFLAVGLGTHTDGRATRLAASAAAPADRGGPFSGSSLRGECTWCRPHDRSERRRWADIHAERSQPDRAVAASRYAFARPGVFGDSARDAGVSQLRHAHDGGRPRGGTMRGRAPGAGGRRNGVIALGYLDHSLSAHRGALADRPRCDSLNRCTAVSVSRRRRTQ